MVGGLEKSMAGMGHLRVVVAAAALSVCALEAHASHISLDTRPSSRFSDGNVSVRIDVRNRGDEAAADVWASARLGDAEASSARLARLDVDETAGLEIELGPPPLPSGEHSIIIIVHYTDLNAYPFSAVTTIPVLTDAADPVSEKVQAELSTAKIRRGGKLTLKLSTHSDRELPVRAELALPDELVAQESVREIALTPGSRHEVVFAIRNRSARSGSRYVVTAVVDYRDGNRHRSLAVNSIVHVVPRRDAFTANRVIWMTVAGVLAALFVLVQFVKPRRAAGLK